MAPVVNIWYGINLYGNYELLDKIIQLDAALEDSYSDLMLDDLEYSFFHVDTEVCGFGVSLFRHDWDTGVVALDLNDLNKRVAEVSEKVSAQFKAWNLPDPQLLLQTDQW